MSDQPKKKKFEFTNAHIRKALGVLLLLVSAMLFLAPYGVLYGLSYIFVYPFGLVGYYLVQGALAIIGVVLMFAKLGDLFKKRFVFGYVLIAIGIGILLSSGFNVAPGSYDSIYRDALPHAYAASELGGGILLTFLSSMLSSIGVWLAYVVGGVVTAVGAFLFITPLLKRSRELLVTPSSEEEAQEEEVEEEIEEAAKEIDAPAEEFQIPEPKKEEPKVEEKAAEPAPKIELEEEEDDSPLSHFNFTPAGRMDLPTRTSRREASSTESPAEPKKEKAVDPLAPKPIPNPNPSLYRNNPVRVSGLREAVFDPDGFDEVAPKDEATFEDSLEQEPSNEAKEFSVKPIPKQQLMFEPEEEEVEEETKQEENPFLFVPPVKQEEEVEEEIEPEEEEPRYVQEEPRYVQEEEPRYVQKEEPRYVQEEPKQEEKPLPVKEEIIAPAPSFTRPFAEPKPTLQQESAPLEDAFVAEPLNDEPEMEDAAIEEEPAKEEPKVEPKKPYVFPSSDLLKVYEDATNREAMKEECEMKMANINQTLNDLKAGAQVVSYVIGPSTTRFDVQMDPHVPVSSLNKCIKDIGIRLGGVPTRFVEIVPGHSTSALEVVNAEKRTVPFKEVFEGLPQGPKYNMVIPFGENIEGKVVAADLSKFPHMLLAGTTGSGKSIFMHGIIMSLLMRNSPDDLKIVLVDPKRVEMSKYKDLPHLLCPIIKEPSEAKMCLKKLCDEMEKRYGMLEENGVSEIREYNELMAEEGKKGMPFVVCFIDEYADLVESAKEVGEYVLKLAAKSRAAGIHLVVATQRPDVKVITGTIKANLPVRVALSVKSSVDSITILGQGGAEDLAGHGDMLVDCSLIQKREFVRAQGCLVDNHEIRRVTDFIRSQRPADYNKDFLDLSDPDEGGESNGYDPNAAGIPAPSPAELKNASQEEKYQMIKSVIMTREFTSISQIQRDFSVGFPRAGKIFSRLQAEGIVAKTGDAPNSSHGSKVLVHSDPAAQQTSSPIDLPPTQNDVSPDFGD